YITVYTASGETGKRFGGMGARCKPSVAESSRRRCYSKAIGASGKRAAKFRAARHNQVRRQCSKAPAQVSAVAMAPMTPANTIRSYPRAKFVQPTPIYIAEYGSLFGNYVRLDTQLINACVSSHGRKG
ncbi:MAG: hypothetical protein ABSG46_06095, partial [Candidatus Binataceae bacterium]